MVQKGKKIPQHIHFTGVGGISMSGLAAILLHYGFTVSGSDIQPTAITQDLQRKGLRFFPQHHPENIDGCELVVYTAAVQQDNPELEAARKRGIKKMERSTFLGRIMQEYQTSIAVAGTHGKTTTTAMLGTIFMENHLDPTILLGGEMDLLPGNYRLGSHQYFITEACEYHDTFLQLTPQLAVLLNMDNDHLDYFGDMNGVKASFRRFMERIPEDGHLIIPGDEKGLLELTEGLQALVTTYGLEEGVQYQARDIKGNPGGQSHYLLLEEGEEQGQMEITLPGEHNIKNSLAAIAAARIIGVPIKGIAAALKIFPGTRRRFQRKGNWRGSLIIDDYAHHPREITATLKGAKTLPYNRLWVVFQPHLYSRTRLLLEDFAHALLEADEIIIAPIYGAREIDAGEVSPGDLVDRIEELGGAALHLPNFQEITCYLRKTLQEGDLLITMGAGDIYGVGEELLLS